jgi:tripartite-type tricarboxylate transporter receptor subunit TctC
VAARRLADRHFRLLADLAGRRLGQPVVAHRTGASGTLGAQLMAKETPGEGYLVG